MIFLLANSSIFAAIASMDSDLNIDLCPFFTQLFRAVAVASYDTILFLHKGIFHLGQ